jgi:ornithine carbamoyltransferase
LSPSDIQIGSREPISDIGKNLERWVDGIMIRTFAHKNAEDLAQAAGIPVINALTDLLHPCQAMADFFTLKEKKGSLSSLKLAYIGDGNNVCHSLLLAAAKTGTLLNIATPEGYEPSAEILALAEKEGKGNGFKYSLTTDPRKAARDADAVYTDVWASMGQEAEKESKNKIFRPYQVNSKLMNEAKKNALFMHCLPAHRGEEVTDDVIDSENSVVFDQAENRLHVQKAIMLLLLTNK